jgi:hypothetical protein
MFQIFKWFQVNVIFKSFPQTCLCFNPKLRSNKCNFITFYHICTTKNLPYVLPSQGKWVNRDIAMCVNWDYHFYYLVHDNMKGIARLEHFFIFNITRLEHFFIFNITRLEHFFIFNITRLEHFLIVNRVFRCVCFLISFRKTEKKAFKFYKRNKFKKFVCTFSYWLMVFRGSSI